ncbi:hypothetical protein COCVIDRAFT_32171 [Bipolaris victoriae FI3]|uniref:MULE transposase domain-containing protein n=1 Tax=Bipolaris victoriae (strain FI3) TaxID=930091 RepID=W7DZN4_BIPV3|nr:hypothetical protein COCVIDRAFT_32171 [Bipolaris victoriae FI3]
MRHTDYYWAIANFLHKTGVQQPRVFISDQEEALKMAARSLLPRVPQLLCGQTLVEALQQVSTSVTVSVPTSLPGAGPVTTCISVSIPAPAPLPSLTSPRSSPPVAVAVSVTMAPSPVWRPPTLEEFLADIEGRRSQPVLYQCNDMMSATNFLAETGQEEDPIELVEARNMALATQGLFASCTPTMAWNYHFGDMEAFYTERFAQVDVQNALAEREDVPKPRPKRAAAVAASKAWKSLGPR